MTGQQRRCVACDHEFFVGWHNVETDRALWLADRCRTRRVGLRVKRCSEPGKFLSYASAHRCGVLPDPGGKYKSIETAKRRGQQACIKTDTIDKVFKRKASARILTCIELTHIIADPGESFKPAFAIEHRLYLGSGHLFFFEEIENDTRIDLARPRAHWQTIERSEPHGALNAAPIEQSAHRTAAAEMRNNHPSARDVRQNLLQAVCNVFIGQAVEPITANALGVKTFRDRIVVGKRAVAAMKSRIEARHLRDAG